MDYDIYEVPYRYIFDKVPVGDILSLEYVSGVEKELLSHPTYRAFVEDKVALRHALERQYRESFEKRNTGRTGFRAFIYDLYTDRNPRESFPFFQKEIDAIMPCLTELFEKKYAGIEETLSAYLYDKTTLIQSLLKVLDLFDHYLKARLKGLFSLCNGQVLMRIDLRLDDIVKEKFIRIVQTDSYSNCFGYENPVIYDKGKEVFGALTHEGIYSID